MRKLIRESLYPSDFLLNQVNADFSSQKQVDMVLDAWANTPTSTKMKPGSTAPLPERATVGSLLTQLHVALLPHLRYCIQPKAFRPLNP